MEHARPLLPRLEAARADLARLTRVRPARLALACAPADLTPAPSGPLPLPDAGPMITRAAAEEPLAVLLPASHPLAGRPALHLTDLADARWIDAPDTAVPLAELRAAARSDGFAAQVTYGGTDLRGLGMLVAAGHGLAALAPGVAEGLAGTVAVRVSAPRLVHRTEIVHPRGPGEPVRALVVALAG
ncbi:LysR substrate-binding domain-containing protein [Streptomyces sp. MBT27]|uniref:LysR substrate-binding domain-containing protein n=1 Tax=Streptomyces sp. MBT27 TaxID=1488356 RepID=UPI001F07CCB8|nr:LysR substrate-binding domain-containing protein [Streptomyces sp. MBT27]